MPLREGETSHTISDANGGETRGPRNGVKRRPVYSTDTTTTAAQSGAAATGDNRLDGQAAYKPEKKELERFFALSIDMLCIAGFDGYFKLVNSAWETTLGFSVPELLSRPFSEFLHPDDRESTAATYAAQMAEGRDVIEFENRYVCKDGSYRWLRWNARTVPEREVIYAVAHDITERKRVDEELRSLNESLEARVRERTQSLSEANKRLRAEVVQRQKAEQEVRLLQRLTVAINEAEDIESALAVALRMLCDATGWVLGQAWVPNSGGTALECSPAWYTSSTAVSAFREASERLSMPGGMGIPGRVWRTKKPVWIRQMTADPNSPRAACARAAGIKAGLAVPVLSGPELVAVLEFFMFKRRKGDGQLLEMVSAVAAQLGSLIQRKRAEETARYLTHYDVPTALPNRLLLKDRLNIAIAQARREAGMVGLIFIRLDRFGLLNDSAGYTAGSQLLQSVAKGLRNIARDGDTVARVGGDRFAMMLPALERPQDAVYIAKRVLERLRGRRTIGSHEFHVTASAGIALFPADGDDADMLLSNAGIAMHRAEERGGDEYQLYASSMNAQVLERLSLENGIRRALERQEFDVYYQPQVDGLSGEIVGAEALVRWNHPDRGLVLPGEFVPVAEEAGLITELGEWVLRSACAQNTAWREKGLPPLRVGVNLAVRQCQEAKLVEKVAKVLRETRLKSDCLELEITEGSFITNAAATIASLRDCREMGVRISLDDFGTGYSSLSYLRHLPIDTLKIDQSFVRTLTTDPSGAAITAAIIAMAHILNLKVIAEGVETEHQLAFLQERRCNEFQGYLFGKPMPAAEFERVLKAGQSLKRRLRANEAQAQR